MNAIIQPLPLMGEPAPRIDARLRVTGQARYAADFPLNNPAFAFLVISAIAKGKITSLDLAEAQAVPGVLHIMTHENAGGVKDAKFFGDGGPMAETIRPLESAEIFHDGQIIGVVLADTYEAAREAAYKVKVAYDEQEPSATFDSPGVETKDAKDVSKRHQNEPQVGDVDNAIAKSEFSLVADYETQTMHHNAMELFATTCAWADDRLTIYEPSQFVYGLQNGVAQQLGIEPEKIHVINPVIGGAFGSKGSVTQRTVLIAMAAKKLKRPVKLVATRDQGFTIATYRAETMQRVRMAAEKTGKITAFSHEGWEVSSRPDNYLVGGNEATVRMYASPNIFVKSYVVNADRNTPGFMRSPPETPYFFGLESAMDEMAVLLKMDPIEFRRINDTMVDPVKKVPYTSRSLMQCYDQGAKAFGWADRNPETGSMRDGDWMIGWGCATAAYPSQMGPATARVKLDRDGKAHVQAGAHDVGGGAGTVIAQMAAEQLGIPLENVSVEIGDSLLPPAPVAGGSITTASTCSAVMKACGAIRERLYGSGSSAAAGGADGSAATTGSGGAGTANAAGNSLEAAFERLGQGVIEEYAEWVPHGLEPDAAKSLYKGQNKIVGGPQKDRISFAFGAEFVEVRINAYTREIRVPRIVGAFAAGRIMNARTARSQYMGGMIWGISSALHEVTEIDVPRARYVNDNLADYLVPVHADIRDMEIIMIPEEDKDVNPAGIKGIGELANVGTSAAIANAVYHATGKRIRKLPIRIEDLLEV